MDPKMGHQYQKPVSKAAGAPDSLAIARHWLRRRNGLVKNNLHCTPQGVLL
jgi:hypothetical protein